MPGSAAHFRNLSQHFLASASGFLAAESVVHDFIEIAAIHLPRFCCLQFEWRRQLDRLLLRAAVAVFQPPDHPAVNGLAILNWRTVAAGTDGPRDLVFRPVNAVPVRSLLVGVARALYREKIPDGGNDQPRLRRK